ncbi:ATP-binding protein [Desulfonatronovibrio hydrogenovorans]|uniref:ATP-binding protein n=1 Tax=Desulfonatronovibrio hydrogenovorans TaxID=53245 RepID=UPI00048DD0D1|nr:ATP-binding protein [Desulfonatronovibrio hydrogenovorans]
MKCTRCKDTAVIALPSHNAGFCPECYLLFFERQVEKAIKDKKLFSHDDKILIALSGGKDSLALAWQLKKLGYDVSGLHIDLAIPGSSADARSHVERFCSENRLELYILEMEKMGLPIPEVKKIIKRPVCSVCGKIKRYYFNKFAMDNGFNVLATGHNLDDEVARLFSNVFRWDAAYLGDQGPLLPAENGFVRKVKPLYRMGEFETANLSFLAGIDYGFTPCPYSKGASFTFYKTLMDELEHKQPGRKLNFYEGFLSRGQKAFAKMDREEGQKPTPCLNCGYPTSEDICGVCRIRQILGDS